MGRLSKATCTVHSISALASQERIKCNKAREYLKFYCPNIYIYCDNRDFLDTVKNYRLNTEQTSTLKSLVRAFAYAEEFSCCPPRFNFLQGISILLKSFYEIVWLKAKFDDLKFFYSHYINKIF